MAGFTDNPAARLHQGKHTDGDPSGGVPSSIILAEQLNNMIEEIDNALTLEGIAPNFSRSDQLKTAIQNHVQNARNTAIASAKSYTDTAKTQAVASASSYTDAAETQAIASANSYTDAAKAQAINSAVSSANSYTDAAKAQAVAAANTYSDSLFQNPSITATTLYEKNFELADFSIGYTQTINLSESIQGYDLLVFYYAYHFTTHANNDYSTPITGFVTLYKSQSQFFKNRLASTIEGAFLQPFAGGVYGQDSRAYTFTITNNTAVFGRLSNGQNQELRQQSAITKIVGMKF